MGDMADDIMDRTYDHFVDGDGIDPEDSHQEKWPEGMWKTGSGDFIPIRAMSTSHLANAIRMMQAWDYPPEVLLDLEEEMGRRENAQPAERSDAPEASEGSQP